METSNGKEFGKMKDNLEGRLVTFKDRPFKVFGSGWGEREEIGTWIVSAVHRNV